MRIKVVLDYRERLRGVWMNYWLYNFFFCLFAGAVLMASTEMDRSIEEGDYKKAIKIYQSLINNEISAEEKEALQLKVAIVYFKDQDQEKAFKTFLELLENIEPQTLSTQSEDDILIYEKALEIYLDHKAGNPLEIATKIVQDYTTILNKHPHAYFLGYILASANANLNQYDKFFELFYRAYKFCPDHFLAYKAKAVLHIKLFERSRTAEEREFHRKAILSLLSKASERQPNDDSLYKFLVSFASAADKSNMLHTCLNKIIDKNIIISRSDIAFYVEEAVKAKDLSLAQSFVNKTREWYQYSRVVNVAQQYLDKHLNN